MPVAAEASGGDGDGGPAVVVHGAADLALVLTAWSPHRGGARALQLLSAPAAGCFLGPLWWASLIEQAQPPLAAAAVHDWLDCGTSPGRAMQALRLGLRRLILAPCGPQHAALLARAAPLGARVLAARPVALDLAAPDSRRLLPGWLATGAMTAPTSAARATSV